MVMLLGFTAIVVDVGKLYAEKSSLQKSVDAAVLGSAQVLTTSQAEARRIARELSLENKFTLPDSNISITSDTIGAINESIVPMTFARVLGINEIKVSAKAKAKIAPISSAVGITPIAIEQGSIGPGETALNCENTGRNSGNCNFLALDGSGASNLSDAILNGSEMSVSDDEIIAETEPGRMVGPVTQAINELIVRDQDKPHCQIFGTADNTCERVIHIAVVETFTDLTGRDSIRIIGFAAYWLEGMRGQSIIGHFIDTVTAGDIGGAGGDYGLFGVTLIE